MHIKNRFLHPLGVLGLASVLVLTACSGGEERQAEYLAQAQTYLDQGDYDSARIDVKNALQINPNSAEGRYLMALLEERDKNWRAVFGNLNSAVELDPVHVKANVKLGQMNLLANNIEEAKKRAQIALDLEPANADALALMGSVAIREERRGEAEDYAMQALSLDPGQETAIAIMVALYGEDEPEKALAFVETGRTADPDNIPIRVLKIRLLESQGKTDAVIAEYQGLIADNPNNASYINSLANYYVQKERLDDAEALLREAVVAAPEDVQAKMALAKFLMQQRSVGDAIAELETMLAATPDNFKIRNGLGELYIATGETDKAVALYKDTFNYDVDGSGAQLARNKLAELAMLNKNTEEARRWLDEALDIEPENPEALINYARIKLSEGDYKQAIPDLRIVLRSNPESVPAMLLLADAQQKDRAVSLALDNYQKVLALQPDNMVALYQSARLLNGQQQYEKAALNIEKVLEQKPDNIQAINLLADVYSKQERWDDAVALTKRLSENEATRPVADLMAGSLELRQGNYEEAAKLAKSALEKNEQLVGAVPIVAQAYASMGDVDGAIAYVEAFLEKHPDNGQLYDVLARLQLAKNDPVKAEAAYKKSIELAPEQVASYINLARLYGAQGKRDQVEGLFLQGIESNPSNILLRTELGVLYQMSGRYEEALAQLEEAYKLDNKSPIVTNNLATLLIDQYPTEENLRRVQELTLGFERSDNPAQLDTLGWLQLKLGNTPQAISLLKAAQEKGGQGPDYWYHLGMAYYKNDQPDLAKIQLGKALENDKAQFFGRDEAEKVYSSL